MERLDIETSSDPTIILEYIRGTLTLRGWDRNEIRADVDGKNNANLNKEGDTIHLKCSTNCVIRVPHHSKLEIGPIGGEAIVKLVHTPLTIESVGGALVIKNTGEVEVGAIGGQLNARNIQGGLSADTIGGSAVVRDIDGLINIGSAASNLIIRGIAHGVTVSSKGNVTMRLESGSDGAYEVDAMGNINCRLSEDTNATVHLKSGAHSISVKAPGISETINQEKYEFTIGDGEDIISLKAQGRIELKSFSDIHDLEGDFDFDFIEDITSLADDITQQVSEQIEGQMEALSIKLSNLNLSLGSDIPRTRRAEAAVRRAERKVAAAQRRLERKVNRVKIRAESRANRSNRSRRHSRAYSLQFDKNKTASEPVSEAERLLILQMIQEKKINVEDGEMLLSALEGQTSATGPIPPEPPEPPSSPKSAKARKSPKPPKAPKPPKTPKSKEQE